MSINDASVKTRANPPWATGPGEILQHGVQLLSRDSDSNRRLAMISIDNAVELMIKTFIGLPSRITGLKLTRREIDESSQTFPQLLDAIDCHASEKLTGIDLGEIEWYHRLRNQLYHQGNGLTVERVKVEVYAELANQLFFNLFGVRLIEATEDGTQLLGDFMTSWIELEQTAARSPTANKSNSPLGVLQSLLQGGIVSESEFNDIDNIRQIRNSVVHGSSDYHRLITRELVQRVNRLTEMLKERLPQKPVV